MSHETRPDQYEYRSRVGLAAASGALILGVTAMTATGSANSQPVSRDAHSAAPINYNAITIVVDDMNDFDCADAEQYLPKSSTWLVEQGTCFDNASTPTPVCCPSRSELMTGQLSHNNNVERQIDARKLKASHTIQYALGQTGMGTFGTGKMLNGVKSSYYMSGAVKTGFQDFNFWNSTDYNHYLLYDKAGQGYYPDPELHITVRAGNDLRQFIERQTDINQPFYGYAAFYAPHTQDRHKPGRATFPDPTPANDARPVPPFKYDPEPDTQDKLPPFRKSTHTKKYYSAMHTERVQALYDIDDQIAETFELLEQKGVLQTTAVIFVSDNGFVLGQNGWEGKTAPYRDSVNIPLMAYMPGKFAAGKVDTRPVSIIDIAPTYYDIFDLTPNHLVDGHSLLSDYRRRGQYFEFRNEHSKLVIQESGALSIGVPTWRMYRRGNKSYIEYYKQDGAVIAQEYYEDVAQKRNLLYAGDPSPQPSKAKLNRFRAKLRTLGVCAGTVKSDAPNPCL